MIYPSPSIGNKNIFVLIERFLATSSIELGEQIKDLSHQLTNEAYEQAKKKFPGKKIGADEYAPLLLETIRLQAKEAESFSVRMIKNNFVTKSEREEEKEPDFIFKVSEKEQQEVQQLFRQLLSEKKRHPEGLIFAYNGIIERRNSIFKYCTGIEATVFNHTARLLLKAQNLIESGEDNTGQLLIKLCGDIKEKCMPNSSPNLNHHEITKDIIACLSSAKNNPRLQTHRGVKQMIANFILALSVVGLVYLASTAESRGTFWYRPQTDSENKICDLIDKLEEPTLSA